MNANFLNFLKICSFKCTKDLIGSFEKLIRAAKKMLSKFPYIWSKSGAVQEISFLNRIYSASFGASHAKLTSSVLIFTSFFCTEIKLPSNNLTIKIKITRKELGVSQFNSIGFCICCRVWKTRLHAFFTCP